MARLVAFGKNESEAKQKGKENNERESACHRHALLDAQALFKRSEESPAEGIPRPVQIHNRFLG